MHYDWRYQWVKSSWWRNGAIAYEESWRNIRENKRIASSPLIKSNKGRRYGEKSVARTNVWVENVQFANFLQPRIWVNPEKLKIRIQWEGFACTDNAWLKDS